METMHSFNQDSFMQIVIQMSLPGVEISPHVKGIL